MNVDNDLRTGAETVAKMEPADHLPASIAPPAIGPNTEATRPAPSAQPTPVARISVG